MFDRAAASLIAMAAACAAAAMAVFAAGFALYALTAPLAGPAGAAAIVAGVAALLVGVYALVQHLQTRAKEREADAAQAALLDSLPLGIGGLAREHPLAAIAVTVLGGALAARHPRLTRDLIAIIARFTKG
jgi:hypothetical protein